MIKLVIRKTEVYLIPDNPVLLGEIKTKSREEPYDISEFKVIFDEVLNEGMKQPKAELQVDQMYLENQESGQSIETRYESSGNQLLNECLDGLLYEAKLDGSH